MNEQAITAMANIMINARRAHEDVGELIAAALHDAAQKLDGADDLVSGRPGSWESAIVLKMAEVGGFSNHKRISQLSALFVVMGKVKTDGGDILSRAMGEAVNTLGGLDQFAGDSKWYWDLVNIGCQYSDYPYPL